MLDLIRRIKAPFFFYDLDLMQDHMRRVKESLPPSVKVWYACKANPHSEVLRVLNELGIGVDVASLGELSQAQAAMIPARNTIATGPAKSPRYLRSLLEANVNTIVIESFNQLRDLNQVAREMGRTQDVLLRVQLDWPEDIKSVLGGAAVTPFGLGVEDWKRIDLGPYQNLNILGLHCFQWGNMLDLEKLAFTWDITMDQCSRLARELGIELKVLDLGGGLGVSYQDERRLDFKEVSALLLRLKQKYRLPEIWLELGRFTVAECGSYFTPIVDVKEVRNSHIIVTEGGINHIARPALVAESFPCVAVGKEGTDRHFAVHGPLCTALDYLGEFKLSSQLAPGDWLEFKKCGAYGMTESMPYFLCHDLPAEVIKRRGEIIITRPNEGPQKWMV
jgi:diaminopimelate decarboxylase